jgi:4-amino-4-deoxychorismate lyase
MWRTRYEGYAARVPDRVLVSTAELFGDGVFETVHLRPAGPWLLDEHLARLARSAALLEIDVPPGLPAEIGAATDGWTAAEGALRILLTRESHHVTVSAVPAAALRERRDGIRLITAGLGVPAGSRPPWSLTAAKTLSYANNFAARRWARRQGADDVLWLSLEGYALEAPTASLVWLAGDRLGTVPAAEADILPGTTVARLLSLAPAAGLRAEPRMITRDELAAADGIWLASALRGLAEAITLDGEPRPRSPWTPRLLDLLGFSPGA